jgi:phage-related protein (TIGR01555 family)
MNRRQRKKARMTARPAVTPTPAQAAESFKVTADHILTMRARPATKKKALQPEHFRPYEPPKGVLPTDVTGKKLAMDAGFNENDAFGLLANVNAVFDEGYAFPGFTVLANQAQIPEFRRPAEVYAREMTRKWIKIKATGDEKKVDKIKALEAEFRRLNVQAVFRKAIEKDGLFGRAQIFLDMGAESDQLDPGELKTELTESSSKIGRNSLKRLTVVEPIWSYPNRYNADNPLDPTFYKPTSWFVMGKEIHSSRLMTIVSREVPDILKPAYAFAGLSLSQMIKPYADNWLRTRQSVSDLIHAFTVWTLKTDMTQLINKGGVESFYNRLQLFNLGRDNHGINAISKDGEEFANVSAPLGGLDKLQAQSQEQMCAPTGLPLVYLTGITPSGLNATSDGEIEVFQDTLSANQEIYTPFLSKVLNIAQLSLFGEVDPEIGFEWNAMRTMSEEQRSNIRKAEAETDAILIGAGVIFQEESRTRIANEEDSPYHGLDVNASLPEVPEPETGPLEHAEKLSGTQEPKDEKEEEAA